MTAGASQPQPSIGFLTVAQHAPGLFGGYLLLNLLGRPLEFHCTTPVKPSRAQEILYGPTLGPYLCGELIGPTLVAKAMHKPLVVLTDLDAMLSLRAQASVPVAVVEGADAGASVWRRDDAHASPRPALATFRWGANNLAIDPLFAGDRELLIQRLDGVCQTLDLAEPFQRIREAIEEAQRGSP
jgi:hypothetical protein